MKILTKIIIKIIKFYQYLISPLLGNNCRYLPTCSEYFIECLKEYGLIKGFFKGLIIEVASLGALFLGLLGAVKFSDFFADLLTNSLIGAVWPFKPLLI